MGNSPRQFSENWRNRIWRNIKSPFLLLHLLFLKWFKNNISSIKFQDGEWIWKGISYIFMSTNWVFQFEWNLLIQFGESNCNCLIQSIFSNDIKIYHNSLSLISTWSIDASWTKIWTLTIKLSFSQVHVVTREEPGR
jgi:hypothetical protein